MESLIIVADDFAGAADCAVAFAARGFRTVALLGSGEARGWAVRAYDTDSRDASPEDAAERVRAVLGSAGPGDAVFDKIDSTLRGNLAAELRELCAAVGAPACVIAAPAFPDTGRTTRGGRQLLEERPLEETEFAGQVESSDLVQRLEPSGLPVAVVPLEAVRGGELPERVARCCAEGGGVLVCDAEDDEDLEAIAGAGSQSGCAVVWLGSAGLARQLAAVLTPRTEHRPDLPEVTGRPLLIVAGTPAAATRRQVVRLLERVDAAEVELDRDVSQAAAAVAAALGDGRDCVLTLAGGEEGARHAGREGTHALGRAAAGARAEAGGLVLTGGETARGVLESMSAPAVALIREIRPGIAFGVTEGPSPVPVAIKAGGFGDDDALLACRAAMRGPEDGG